ncbi:MAG: DMT family transporter [Prevotella sp.]|nr:DMT family transporter [Prevotella sp.]
MKHKGIICGILAAVCYGTNPFGALPLYEEGVNTASVLFYRFSTAVIMLATMLLAERKSFCINGSELKTLGSLGLLLAYSFTSPDLHLMLPPSPRAWFFACWLGLVPTVLSLVFMTIAVHEVGATPTAIMGALEPLTAVAIGVTVFGESLTLRLFAGIVLILSAVLLIVLGKNFHLRTIGHTITSIVRKTWRWKS